MDISAIMDLSPPVILKGIAERVRARRLELNLTQRSFASRAGVGYDAYRRFENSGDITLNNLVLCAVALGDVEGFLALFTKKSYQSVDELLKVTEVKKRKRGSRND